MKHVIPNPRASKHKEGADPAPPAVAPTPGARKLRFAAALLWLVAMAQIIVGIVYVVLAPEEWDDRFHASLQAERRISLHEVMAAPLEMRAGFDQQRLAAIRTLRWWHAADIISGVAILAGALLVRRRPFTATVGALSLFFVAAMVTGIFGSTMSPPIVIWRVTGLAILSVAIFAAFVGREEAAASKSS
jgi:hypothetical protein